MPKRWRRLGNLGLILYGGTLGAGVGTRIVSTSFYVVLIGIFVNRNVKIGLVVMITYGLARGLPVALLSVTPFTWAEGFMTKVNAWQHAVGLVSALVMGTMTVWLYKMMS